MHLDIDKIFESLYSGREERVAVIAAIKSLSKADFHLVLCEYCKRKKKNPFPIHVVDFFWRQSSLLQLNYDNPYHSYL
jgi:hypothetical protein